MQQSTKAHARLKRALNYIIAVLHLLCRVLPNAKECVDAACLTKHLLVIGTLGESRDSGNGRRGVAVAAAAAAGGSGGGMSVVGLV